MPGFELIDFACQRVGIGQQQRAHQMKRLVSTIDHPMVRELDFGNDQIFLEPSLFGYFGIDSSCLTIDQILCGYLDDERRPSTLVARPNLDGRIYLPRLGTISTESSSLTEISRDTIEKQLVPARFIGDTHVELCEWSDPLLESVFFDSTEQREPPHLVTDDSSIVALENAMATLNRVAPVLFDCLFAVTKRVVIFQSDQVHSFAASRAHGTVFLNDSSPTVASESYFIEDLAHQCGHVLFSALTTNPSEFLAIETDVPLGKFTGISSEQRDVYTAFHGIFTEALMCLVLEGCLNQNHLQNRERHELVGRLSFAMHRFQFDLANLKHDGIFNDLGCDVVRQCGQVFDAVYHNTKERITVCDLRNQAYTFDYKRFTELNAVDLQIQ